MLWLVRMFGLTVAGQRRFLTGFPERIERVLDHSRLIFNTPIVAHLQDFV